MSISSQRARIVKPDPQTVFLRKLSLRIEGRGSFGYPHQTSCMGKSANVESDGGNTLKGIPRSYQTLCALNQCVWEGGRTGDQNQRRAGNSNWNWRFSRF